MIYSVAGRNLLTVRVVQACLGAASCALLASTANRLSHAVPDSQRPTGRRIRHKADDDLRYERWGFAVNVVRAIAPDEQLSS